MAVCFHRSSIVVSAVILCVAAAACSPSEPAAPGTAEQASVLDSLTPEQVVLRGIECHRALNNARSIAERLPADLVARIGDAPKVSFAELTFVGGDLPVTMEDRRDAANSGRPAPSADQPIAPDYLTYLEDCVVITDRVAEMRAEEKAAAQG